MSGLWQWIKRHPYFTTSLVVVGVLVYRWRTAVKPATGRRLPPSNANSNSATGFATPKIVKNPESENLGSVVQRTVVLSTDSEGEMVPDFEAKVVLKGDTKTITAENLKEGKWTVILFYPQNYACNSILLEYQDKWRELEASNCQLIASSNDSTISHQSWNARERSREVGGGGNVDFFLVGDNKREMATKFDIKAAENGKNEYTTVIVSPTGKVVKRLDSIELSDVFAALFGN